MAIPHSLPLIASQRSDIAKSITELYNKTFNAPSIFINVRFVPVMDEDYYCGGKRKPGTNRIFVYTRGCGGRTAETFAILAERVERIWNNTIGATMCCSRQIGL